MTVSYQPWYVGQTFPIWDILLTTDAGPDDITSVPIAGFTITFRNVTTPTNVDTIGTGTFTVKALSPAEVYYQASAADVSVAGVYLLFVKAVVSGQTMIYDPIPLTITAS